MLDESLLLHIVTLDFVPVVVYNCCVARMHLCLEIFPGVGHNISRYAVHLQPLLKYEFSQWFLEGNLRASTDKSSMDGEWEVTPMLVRALVPYC